MRKAYNNYGLIFEGDQFLGVSLGYDYCAEHEWGTGKLDKKFGLPEITLDNIGIKRRSATIVPDVTLSISKSKKISHGVLMLSDYKGENHPFGNYLKYIKDSRSISSANFQMLTSFDIITAWDESSFAIAFYGNEVTNYIKDLYDEILKKNVSLVFYGNDNPFSRSALSILITDRIPDKFIKQMYDADKKIEDQLIKN